ncbi:hypothetical protein Btru_026502 [Bulinus truncatus]|nr:hypothetical protein Btru_026502 [Bulinus truncatus]
MKSAIGISPFFLLDGRQPRRNVYRAATSKSTSHYYDILGITPNATQNQIKAAYYNMSKLHHPDVTECKKSHSLFTEINEAYEVLGNIRKRRMYDKGVYSPQQMSHTHREDTSSSENEKEDYTDAYRQNNNFQRGFRPPPPRGRSKIYNFDEFYRQHYNDIRERRASEYQEFLRYQETQRQYRKNQANQLPLSLILGFWTALFAAAILFRENYDRDLISTKQRKMKSSTNDPLKFINEKD